MEDSIPREAPPEDTLQCRIYISTERLLPASLSRELPTVDRNFRLDGSSVDIILSFNLVGYLNGLFHHIRKAALLYLEPFESISYASTLEQLLCKFPDLVLK